MIISLNRFDQVLSKISLDTLSPSLPPSAFAHFHNVFFEVGSLHAFHAWWGKLPFQITFELGKNLYPYLSLSMTDIPQNKKPRGSSTYEGCGWRPLMWSDVAFILGFHFKKKSKLAIVPWSGTFKGSCPHKFHLRAIVYAAKYILARGS